MCGIVGFQDSDRFPELAQALGSAVESLAHRGPDDSGGFLDAESGIGLGHRRLSVLDLADTARQPMVAADGHLALTYNGEIYNFRELRRELASKGHGFRGEGDTEVLLAAWREWGADCLERLTGMFAMGVWDARARTLFLARDRLGIKPLFYHRRGNGLRFASELKALVALPGFVRRPAPTALPLLLHYGYLPAPLAAFEDTFKLPPGHLAIWKSGELRVRHWWMPPAPATPRPISESAALRELDTLLNQAVSDRLVSDVPLGALLSGGIDSALVTAIMAQAASGPVRTFTIGFGAGNRAEPDYDESGHAASVAEYLGTDHTVFRVTAREALEVIPRLPEIYDEPLADASAIPTVLVSALARTRVTVALSGDGGDELFAGYARYSGTRSAAALAGWIPRAVRRSAGRQMAAVRPGAVAKRYRRISPGLPPPLRVTNVAEKWRKLAGALEADTLESAYRSAVSLWSRADVFDLTGWTVERGIWEAALRSEGGTIARLMAADRVTYLPDDLLAKVDRASMAAGLEVRVPLLDHRVVGFAAELPSRLHYRAGVGKALLRRLLGRYLPPALFERPKMGFAVPVDAWLRGDLAELADDYLAPARLKRAGELNPETVGRFLHAHRRGDRDHGHRLWALLTWQMWRERWIERTS